MTFTIAYDDALRVLREVVAERPDYAYEWPSDVSCLYVHNGCPSCGVGHVLHRLGAPLSLLAEWDGSEGAQFRDLVNDGRVACDDATARLLDVFQARQDSGHTWGQALASAEAAVARMGAP